MALRQNFAVTRYLRQAPIGIVLLVASLFTLFSARSSLAQMDRPPTKLRAYLSHKLAIENPSTFLLHEKLAENLRKGFAAMGDDPKMPGTAARDAAFAADGALTVAGQAALLSRFSPQSREALAQLILSLGEPSYNNAIITGPAGSGKTFMLNQAIAALSFNVMPDELIQKIGFDQQGAPFLQNLRESFFGKTQFVLVDHDLLSRDNTPRGQAYAKAEVRMRAMLSQLFEAAREDFRTQQIRTIFVMEEVATLPPLVQETLKKLLDETGLKGLYANPLDRGLESGVAFWGITTPDEYRQMTAGDSAVERRYRRISIYEPTEAEALNILRHERANWQDRYELEVSDDVLAFIVAMRKFFNYPPLAMPHSVLRFTEGLLGWAANRNHRQSEREVTMEDAYRYLIEQAHLPKDIWLGHDGQPPFKDLAARVQKHLIGHEAVVADVIQHIKRGRATGFHQVPVFIIMGPSGSGKDTLANAINSELFGHDGQHLHFSLASVNGNALGEIIEGNGRDLPRLATAMADHSPHGVIVLNEAKDMPSREFDRLKVFVESGVMRPRGPDPRPRPLGLNAIFIVGQWGEDLFVDKTDDEITRIINALTEADLIAILEKGRDRGERGAVPHALIQRVLRTGGIYILPPVPKSRYEEVVRLNIKSIAENLRVKSQIHLKADDSLVHYLAQLGREHNNGLRSLVGVIQRLTETPISEAMDQGLPPRNVHLRLAVETAGAAAPTLVVESLSPEDGAPGPRYSFTMEKMLGPTCRGLLGQGH